MKKSFVKPIAQVVAMDVESNILAGSMTVQTGGGNGNGGPTSADAREEYVPEGGDANIFMMN